MISTLTDKFRTFSLHFVLLGLFLGLVSPLFGCNGHEAPEETVTEKSLANSVQLTPEAFNAAHITTVTVQARTESVPLRSVAVIKANENRLFHINSFVSGRVVKDTVVLGDSVHAGQTLAVVQNLEVAKIQANYIHELHNNEIEVAQAKTRYALAKSNRDREQRLFAEGISPQKDYQQAKAEATLAKTDLEGRMEHRLHLRNEATALLEAYGVQPGGSHSEKINTNSPIIAPRGGVVLKKNITQGDMVTPDTVLYEVGDLSQIWLDVTVFPKDIARIHPGQSLAFVTDSLPGKVFHGKIDYIQPAVQENSQTYIARAYLNNPHTLLKPGIFGQVSIAQQLARSLTVVPESALQRYGREVFVFIPVGNHAFRKQTVVLGEKVQDGYAVEQGLQPGDRVVGNGSFTLKAELLKTLFEQPD